MIKGLILAAGRGSRLKHLTKNKPKTFNKFKSKKFLDIIIDNFKKNKIKNINIITGYKSSLFKKYKQKKIFNKEWSSTNIFYSLYLAKKLLRKYNCIVSYSDIIFNKNAINLLKKSSGSIVILSNVNWKNNWNLRFSKPLNDLETFKYKIYKKKKYLAEIGSKTNKYKNIQGQFCGLLKIKPSGWNKIIKALWESKINIKKIDITTLLSIVIKKKENKHLVRVVDYKDAWHEIDNLKDFNLLKMFKYD